MGPLEEATFYTGQLTGSAATLATVPTTEDWIVDDVVLCNTDSASHTVTLNFVPPGGSAAVANELLSAFAVAASTTTSLAATLGKLGIVLEAGWFVSGVASTASKVNVWVVGRGRQH